MWWTFGDGFQTLPRPSNCPLNRGFKVHGWSVTRPGKVSISPQIVEQPTVGTIRDGFQTLHRWSSLKATTETTPPLTLDAQDHRSSVA